MYKLLYVQYDRVMNTNVQAVYKLLYVQYDLVMNTNVRAVYKRLYVQYDRVMNTNVRAVYNLTMLAVPHLEATKVIKKSWYFVISNIL